MSKFNVKNVGSKIINRAGGVAYKETPELELVSLMLTSFVRDKFYEGAKEQLDRLESLANEIKDKKFLAQAAVYARIEFGMRSITHALAAHLVYLVKGEEWVKHAIDKIVYRPDDILEIMSFYTSHYGAGVLGDKNRPIPNSLKKGIALALSKFNAYELAKYRGERKEWKIIDVINLVHPKPNTNQKDAFSRLMKGDLVSTDTWESKLTKAGNAENKEEAKATAWKEMLLEHKLGYFALLRNLRNMLSALGETYVDEMVAQLTDENAIKKSLVMPFRFITAYDELEQVSNSRKLLGALNDALEISMCNVPRFEGRNLLVLDESGSMSGQPFRIGSTFLAVMAKANPDSDVMLFSDEARYKSINPKSCITDITQNLIKDFRGCGTDFSSIFRVIDKAYDRIVILSDMQGWMEGDGDYRYSGATLHQAFVEYTNKYNINPHLYSFDLQGHGDMKFPQHQVYCLAGFSEKIFDVMSLLEQDRNALINKIKSIII